jgi:hypothetical protein
MMNNFVCGLLCGTVPQTIQRGMHFFLVQRSLLWPDAPALLGAIRKDRRIVELVSPAGLYLGPAGLIQFDKLLDAVAKRITQGLFFREKGLLVA